MAYTITLEPLAKQFTCNEDETILAAGLRQGYNLRYGCKHGGCGSCKALVVDGEVDQGDASSFALLDFEREQGYALLCSAYPLSDCVIDVSDYEEEELLAAAPIQEYQAEVERITALTHDIRGIHLRLLEPAIMSFKAGQYVDVLVPGTTDWRSYSMANPPSHNGELELMIKLMPGGLFSFYVAERLREGDRLTVQGPYGNFYLRDTPKPALFVAGGSGMAPILALLRDMAEKQNPRRVIYFYGARAGRDLFQLDELHGLAQRLPHFRFIPALSEPLSDEAWQGERGLITEVVHRHVPHCGGMEAYMCGPTVMIDAALALLLKGGIDERAIFSDKFVTKAETESR
jgi:propane monooxygenase reductase subunit